MGTSRLQLGVVLSQHVPHSQALRLTGTMAFFSAFFLGGKGGAGGVGVGCFFLLLDCFFLGGGGCTNDFVEGTPFGRPLQGCCLGNPTVSQNSVASHLF